METILQYFDSRFLIIKYRFVQKVKKSPPTVVNEQHLSLRGQLFATPILLQLLLN